MSPAPIESTLPGSLSSESSSLSGKKRQFANLRGVRWRINLGILPSSSSIDDIRRVTADSRRRYAGLRRRLLVEPHVPKDGSNCPDLVMDNPLSQNPDSMWGRFFRNAELEKMVDQDLSRLYPEHGRYFQTPGCQGMLRRILLLWCLRHPEYGYRQGMHELLAPLLFVLHVDVEHLSQVRKLYEDHFTDKFDDLSFHESDLTYNFDLKKFPDSLEDEIGCHGNAMKVGSLGEVDPEIQTIVLLSDAYGAEGELGIVLSEKFMEHDAYCMFDALMSGARGAVAMADFFSPSPIGGSHTGLPPVIEASSALYHLLSIVDSSLHSHLVELGVEPQYFALRWLRVLFGREFSLEDLLIIWDEIFASDNSKLNKGVEDDTDSSFAIFNSPRGAFISAMAVSMILNLRSSLLATENATTCLQRLLNFQESINLKKLIEKAKSLRTIALEANSSNPYPSFRGAHERSKLSAVRSHSLSFDCSSPTTPLSLVPESYWEEKWRVLHKEEELKRGSSQKQVPTRKKGWSEKVRLHLSRTGSDPSHMKVEKGKKDPNHLIGNTGSEENSSIFSASTSPLTNDHENDSEKSSIVSNSSLDENDDEPNNAEAFRIIPEDPLPVSDPPEDISPKPETNNDSTGKQEAGLKERKLLSGKFQWFWKFGRNAAGEETSEKEGASEAAKSANRERDAADQIMMSTLKNLGQSMLENIQVIESVFQQDRGQGGSLENFSKNVIVGKGQVTAMAALKELRKISNLLSEM
uniref:Rab-GAP TBC domain-containing protein n=1 Tax=Vitis vinifera TaxID=29760 RepID=F6I5N6_VITVI